MQITTVIIIIIILIALHYLARLTTATLSSCVVFLLDIVPTTYITPAMVADMVSLFVSGGPEREWRRCYNNHIIVVRGFD